MSQTVESTLEILVRPARTSDAEHMIALVNGIAEEPDRNIPLAPGEFNLSVEEEQKILDEYARSDNSIFLVATTGDQLVGILNCTGGKRRATRHAVTLGISVRKGWRNKGVGQRLMQAAIEWAWGTGIITRIELFVYARNLIAIHVYEKFGFRLEGHRQRAVFQDDEYVDDLMMSLLL